jgi:hypothetical protein
MWRTSAIGQAASGRTAYNQARQTPTRAADDNAHQKSSGCGASVYRDFFEIDFRNVRRCTVLKATSHSFSASTYQRRLASLLNGNFEFELTELTVVQRQDADRL